jgi:hypothetical protein
MEETLLLWQELLEQGEHQKIKQHLIKLLNFSFSESRLEDFSNAPVSIFRASSTLGSSSGNLTSVVVVDPTRFSNNNF